MKNRDKFVDLAQKRVNKAIKMLDLIGNLSNRSNYSYTDEDVKKIIKVLTVKVKEVESRFDAHTGSKGEDFRL